MAKKESSKEENKGKKSNAQQTTNVENNDNSSGKEEGKKTVEEKKKKETGNSDNDEIKGSTETVTDSTEEKEDDQVVKLAELQDKYLRLSAEFDNYRKRTLKEKMEMTKSAGEGILLSLLPVMDDFDRAMNMMENATDCKAMKEGIDLIYSKMNEFLKHNGVKEIEAMDTEFDTDMHEAVTKIPAEDKKKKGKVVDVIQKGYYLNDKVMRHSKVVVGE